MKDIRPPAINLHVRHNEHTAEERQQQAHRRASSFRTTYEERAHLYISHDNPEALVVLRSIFMNPDACVSREDANKEWNSPIAVRSIEEALTRHKSHASGLAAAGAPARQGGDSEILYAEYTSSSVASNFDGAECFFVYLTKHMFEEAAQVSDEGIAAMGRLRHLIQQAEDLLEQQDHHLTDCELVCCYEAEASSALIEPQRGGSTFDALLSLWNGFDDQRRIARRYDGILRAARAAQKRTRARHPSQYAADEAPAAQLLTADAEDDDEDADLDGSERRALRSVLFKPLYSEPRHPHHRVTVKLLAKALFTRRRRDLSMRAWVEEICMHYFGIISPGERQRLQNEVALRRAQRARGETHVELQ